MRYFLLIKYSLLVTFLMVSNIKASDSEDEPTKPTFRRTISHTVDFISRRVDSILKRSSLERSTTSLKVPKIIGSPVRPDVPFLDIPSIAIQEVPASTVIAENDLLRQEIKNLKKKYKKSLSLEREKTGSIKQRLTKSQEEVDIIAQKLVKAQEDNRQLQRMNLNRQMTIDRLEEFMHSSSESVPAEVLSPLLDYIRFRSNEGTPREVILSEVKQHLEKTHVPLSPHQIEEALEGLGLKTSS